MQRFFSQAVPSQKQAPLSAIEQGNAEHPPQFRDTVGSDFLIEMNDDFCIGLRRKQMSPTFELLAQLLEIVDFSVENHRDAAVLIKDGLMAACHINDAEPAHSQPNTVLDKDALVVGSTVHHGLAHLMDRGTIDSAIIALTDNASNSAHGFLTSHQDGIHAFGCL